MEKKLDKDLLLNVFKALDDKLHKAGRSPVRLLVGGGAAIVGGYGYPDRTLDADAVRIGGSLSEIDDEIQDVGRQFQLSPDWLNPHYSTFTIYLPKDYGTRLKSLFSGKVLLVEALGGEDLLIMKFMANRTKDLSHIRFLMSKGADLKIVSRRLEELKSKWPDLAKKALERLDDMLDEI